MMFVDGLKVLGRKNQRLKIKIFYSHGEGEERLENCLRYPSN